MKIKNKKPCQKSLDRDKTKNKHYEQTLSLIKIVIKKKYNNDVESNKMFFPPSTKTKC